MQSRVFTIHPFCSPMVCLCAIGIAMSMTDPSHAGGDVPEYAAPLPLTEGRGCYYYRGEEYCGSYCYWEINGKRYCTKRLRNAHSQAGPQHEYLAEPRPYRDRPRYESVK